VLNNTGLVKRCGYIYIQTTHIFITSIILLQYTTNFGDAISSGGWGFALPGSAFNLGRCVVEDGNYTGAAGEIIKKQVIRLLTAISPPPLEIRGGTDGPKGALSYPHRGPKNIRTTACPT
jgi:hypothetical protein